MGKESSSPWARTGRKKKLGGAREPEGRKSGGQEPILEGRERELSRAEASAMAQAMWTAPYVNQAPRPRHVLHCPSGGTYKHRYEDEIIQRLKSFIPNPGTGAKDEAPSFGHLM